MTIIGFFITYAICAIVFGGWIVFIEDVGFDIAILVAFALFWPIVAIGLIIMGFREMMKRYREDIKALKEKIKW